MHKLIENYLHEIKTFLLKTFNFIKISIADQVINSLISLFGSIYILAKLPSHDFAAAGFTIALSYFVSAIIKNKYLNTLNYVDANLPYTAFALLCYFYKKTKVYIVLLSMVIWIILAFSTHSPIFASLLLLLGFALFTADIVRNICIIKNIQKISFISGIFVSSSMFILVALSRNSSESEFYLLIYALFQLSYLLFFVLFAKRASSEHNIDSLESFFKTHISTSDKFKNEAVFVSTLNLFSIAALYFTNPNFYSSMLIAYLFSASIPMLFSNALVPKIQTIYTRNRFQFSVISLIFWVIISLSSLLISLYSLKHQQQVSVIYALNTKQAFDIIFGVVAGTCAISLFQIFYLPMMASIKKGFFAYRFTMYLSLTIVPIIGAFWKNSQYYEPIQILLLCSTAIMVLFPVFLKTTEKNNDS